jgi:hypothetical protein
VDVDESKIFAARNWLFIRVAQAGERVGASMLSGFLNKRQRAIGIQLIRGDVNEVSERGDLRRLMFRRK